jgi:hypothetical protein
LRPKLEKPDMIDFEKYTNKAKELLNSASVLANNEEPKELPIE